MGSSCERGSTSSRWPSSERRDVATVPGDAHQQVCVAPSSCLGGYRDSGDDEAPLEAAARQTSTFTGSAGLQEIRGWNANQNRRIIVSIYLFFFFFKVSFSTICICTPTTLV